MISDDSVVFGGITRVYGNDGVKHLGYRTGLRTLCLEQRGAAIHGRGFATCRACQDVVAQLQPTMLKHLRRIHPGHPVTARKAA